MSKPLTLSVNQARRLVLSAQGFAGRSAAAEVKPARLNQLIERLGVVQIDSVNAVVRSHYLPLFSRLGNYDSALLEQAAWSSGKRRTLFEYWGHEASLMPHGLYPLMRWRMQRAAQGEGIYRQLAQFGRERHDVVQRVLAHIRDQGATGAGALNTRVERAGPWWDWSEEKMALEWLFAAGEVTVAGRRGFERLYDVPERVLPSAWINHPEIDEAHAQRQLLLRSAAALGVATEKDLRDYFRLDPRDSQARLAELLEAGELVPVAVKGWDKPAYCLPNPSIARAVNASALLSPFDSLVWERARTERLFDFRYRLEIYTPQAKRVYGYYVLPFLHNERIAARLDVRAERASGRLHVHALHEETVGLDEAGVHALARNLLEMARWLGLDEVWVNCAKDGSERLRSALVG